MGLTGKEWWYVGGALVGWYVLQSWLIDQSIGELGISGGDMGKAVTLNVKLTTYYPSVDSQMEGGANDEAGRPLPTLDDFRAGRSDYAALSADNTVFPYGQRVSLDAWPDVTFRIVDTGGHFSSRLNKVYRVVGREPIDVASAYPQAATAGHPTFAVMTIYPGDDWAEKKPSAAQSLDYSNVQGQTPQVVADAGGDPSVNEFGDPEGVA